MTTYWQKEIECMPREEIEKLQLKRTKGMLKRAYDRIAWFKKQYDAHGVKPEDFKELDDLSKFPLVQKDDLRDNYPFGLFAEPMENVIRIHASSGTTGKPILGGYTKHDVYDVFAEVNARSLNCCDVTSQDIIQNAYGYGLFTGGLGIHYGGEMIGATVIPISGGNTARQLMLMEDFGSTAITCTPSYMIYLAEEINKRGINRENIKLKVGIHGAEPWSEKMRKKIEELMPGMTAIDIYGLTEIIGPGVSVNCTVNRYKGLHIWEDHFLPEILDPKNDFERVAPGEKGEIAFSTITREATPLPRYRAKDITRLNYEKCACGRTHARHDKITGRTDDMLIIHGINVFPSQIESVLMDIPQLAGYYEIVVDRKDLGSLDKVTIRIELTEEHFSDKVKDIEAFTKEVADKLYSSLLFHAKIELVPPGTIPRSVGKAQRVVDMRADKI
ncbi:MAG: AMP-binding protein [Candidatus Lokiarchaeota archaeon]|nr:AMP-binding protein [Candidatus Lokiarchaeota archaeon]